MPEIEEKTVSQIIRKTWKQLALADQTDADALMEVIKETLEGLESLEAQE